mgnify:CR=1 FL=1
MLDTSVVVREATSADSERVGELLVDSFVSTYGKKMPEVVVTEARKDDLRDVETKRIHECVLVADLGGRIVGTVTVYRPHSPRSRTWQPSAAEIRYMAVASDVQGKGVAESLIREALHRAWSWRAKELTLHVRRGATGVVRFYERLGWKREPKGDRDERPVIYLEGYTRAVENTRADGSAS